MHVFKGWLYVGASGWYNQEEDPVSEIIRIDRAGDWPAWSLGEATLRVDERVEVGASRSEPARVLQQDGAQLSRGAQRLQRYEEDGPHGVV